MDKKTFFWLIPAVILSLGIIGVAAPKALAQGSAAETAFSKGSPQKEEEADMTMIQYVFDFIRNHYVDKVDAKTLYEGALNGMFESLKDPYSQYLSERDLSDLNESIIKGSFGGVGLYIRKLSDDNSYGKPAWVEVDSPIEDGPGWKAGVKPGDFITSIDGQPTDKMTMNDCLAKLKGKVGVKVVVGIYRDPGLTFTVPLTRAVVEVPVVKSAMINTDSALPIGYLKLLSFSKNTSEDAEKAIKGFEKAGYKALILDLRNNYGGLLDQAVKICDMFLSKGVVVSVKSRLKDQNVVYKASLSSTHVPEAMPVIVLINRASASASEIVSGCLKDQRRALLVGERSYGKGSVQQVFPLANDGFKLTMARYYSPSDVNIDKKGIPPDKEVLFPEISDEEATHITRLIKDGKIYAWVEAHPHATPQEGAAFAQELQKQYNIDLTLLERFVRDTQNRTHYAPVYDLDYDVQLKAAVDILDKGQWQADMRAAKTLKQLEDAEVVKTATAT
jgi:carboxyl-terminal processing protease